jgi:hypothetical protein
VASSVPSGRCPTEPFALGRRSSECVEARRRRGPACREATLRRSTPSCGTCCPISGGSVAPALERGEDALQETMFAVVKHLSALREPAALRGWAKQIAVGPRSP